MDQREESSREERLHALYNSHYKTHGAEAGANEAPKSPYSAIPSLGVVYKVKRLMLASSALCFLALLFFTKGYPTASQVEKNHDNRVLQELSNITCENLGSSCPWAVSNCECTDLDEDKETWKVVVEWGIIVVLISLSGLFSGLTLGLMSLDKIGLEIVINGDPDSEDAKNAKVIYPVRAKGNLLLCTLLLGNVMVNTLLAILLADYTGGTVGFITSTAVIVIFGEIMPQAACSRHALAVGAKTVNLVKLFIVLLYVIAKPISLVLDFIFQDEIGSIYTSRELSHLLQIHVKHDALKEEQAKMMGGAIDLFEKLVESVMTPVDKIFMIYVNETLDFRLVAKIFKSGYSRIPVYDKDRNDVVGCILTKDLIVIDPEEGISVRSMIQFFGRSVHWLWPDSKLSDALTLFKKGGAHLAMVKTVNDTDEDKDPFYEVCGLITLEDIIEELLQDEIVDETDIFIEVEKDIKVNRDEFDYARLRLLDSRHGNDLSNDEVNAICGHLRQNILFFADSIEKGELSIDFLRFFINRIDVLLIKAGSNQDHQIKRGISAQQDNKRKSFIELITKNSMQEVYEGVLYKKDFTEKYCTLVLSGKLKIEAGKENFISEAGPWSILAQNALMEQDEQEPYITDFNATIKDDFIRCIRFSREEIFKSLQEYKKKPKSNGTASASVDESNTKTETIDSAVVVPEDAASTGTIESRSVGSAEESTTDLQS